LRCPPSVAMVATWWSRRWLASRPRWFEWRIPIPTTGNAERLNFATQETWWPSHPQKYPTRNRSASMLKYYPPTPEQRRIIRELRYANKKAGLFRMDARARFKNG